MSLVRAYHAGELEEIDILINHGNGIPFSCKRSNWLGDGLYFWENDPERAEEWQLKRNKGAILECEIDTNFLLNLLVKNEDTEDFYHVARRCAKKLNIQNQRDVQRFDLDNQVFKEFQKSFPLEKSLCGVRMAFFLGESVTVDGNLYENQHIQICLWDLSAVENPRKYTAGLKGLI